LIWIKFDSENWILKLFKQLINRIRLNLLGILSP
jgi:hypothetical protein